MAEYIEREATLKEAESRIMWGMSATAVYEAIQEAPAADVAPVRHGRWEQIKEWATKAKYRCSVCGREIMSAVKVNIEKYPYCHCGAKMDGGA